MSDIRSVVSGSVESESPYIDQITVMKVEMDTGKVQIQISFEQKYYYEVLSELTGTQISGEYELIRTMKDLSDMKQEFGQIKDAFADVKMKGYGVVSPSRQDIKLEEPVIIKQGSKFGVKIRSEAPSIHMIRANIETEIAPIVGSEQQAQDLLRFRIFPMIVDELRAEGAAFLHLMIEQIDAEELGKVRLGERAGNEADRQPRREPADDPDDQNDRNDPMNNFPHHSLFAASFMTQYKTAGCG